MQKKKCVYCNQIMDDSMESFMSIKPCNAPDGDGHLWMYNTSQKIPFTSKFPFQYLVKVKSYTAMTTDEIKWNNLQKQLDEKELFDFDTSMICKLEIAGFIITRNYGG